MASTYNSSYEDIILSRISRHNNRRDEDYTNNQLADFQRLRISALTKAAELSPSVKEVTIGPNSPIKKELPITTVSQVDNEVDDNLHVDKFNDDLRYVLIMKEYEKKLQKASEEIFNDLIGNMLAKRSKEMENSRRKQSDDCKRRAKDMERKLQVQMRENDNFLILEKAKLDEQKSKFNKQTLEHMNKVLEEQNKASARFNSISDSNAKIVASYKDITDILNSHPDGQIVCSKYIPSINTVVVNISSIMELDVNNITDKDTKQAEVLASNIANVLKCIKDDLLKAKEDRELRKKLDEQKAQVEEIMAAEELKKAAQVEAERKAQIESEKIAQVEAYIKAQAEQKAPIEVKKSKPMFYSAKSYNHYTELHNFLNNYEAQYKDLVSDNNLKKFRFDCQKAVNTPVNALCAVSGLHMRDKYDKLYKLLKGERVQVLDIYVTATQHPQGLKFCTALLAKKIVRQGDLLVSSNPEAAYPLAAVTVALWSQFPEFGMLLEAYFHKMCPYIVPMFLPQKEGQPDKEFYLSRGYTYSEDGTVEKQDKFLKRISGIFRLQCAIWIARMPKFINAPNPHNLHHAWRWLASFLNLKPEPDICATLLHDFFTICGSECLAHYNKQFKKIIKLVKIQYLEILDKIDEGGPKTRLEVFLQNIWTTGHIEPPSALTQPCLW